MIQKSKIRILNLNHKTDWLIPIGIFFFALGIRVINLDQFLTADEPRSWFGWSINFAQAILEGRGGETFFNYTPGVTLMWLGSLGLYALYLLSPGQSASFAEFLYALPFDPIDTTSIFWFRLPSIIVGSGCIALGYVLLNQLLGKKTALVGTLLLALDPLHIGMTRILGNDGLTASFMFVSTLALISFFVSKTPRPYKKLFLSAIFAGLAILAKTTAIFMFPMVGLVIITVIAYRKQPRLLGAYTLDGLLWLAITFLTIFVLFPALWFQPIETLQNISTRLGGVIDEPHNRGSFFMGQPVPDPGIWFYWTISFFRLTAVTTIGVILALGYLLFQKPSGAIKTIRRNKMIVFLLWAFVIFYLVFLSLGSKKQDRYMVPIMPGVSILAAVGFVWLTENAAFKRGQPLVLGAVLGAQTIISWTSAPYYISHYNLLAGGGMSAHNTVLIGWGEGLDLAANYLNSLPNADTLNVSSWYHSTFAPYFRGHALEQAGDEKVSRSAKPALASDYVVLYVNQVQRQMPTPGMIQFYQSSVPEHVVTINGIDYAFIYPSPALQHPFTGEVRLVGQAELLGYNLLDEQGQSLSKLPADSRAAIELYWEWQGKTPDELISMSVVDGNGLVWGRLEPLGSQTPVAYEAWAEGAIVHDDFSLTLFPGTPPGDYFLKAWIDRPATGERVGDFPILLEDTHIVVTRPTTQPPIAELTFSQPVDASITDEITLLGLVYNHSLREEWRAGERRDVELYWQANQTIGSNYPLTLALADSTGANQVEWFGLPAGGRFPTDRWQPADIIRDPWQLTLPPYVPPGDYQLTVRLGDRAPANLFPVPVVGRPRLFNPPTLDLTLNETFGPAISLLGLNAPTVTESAIDITPGQSLTIELVWQALDRIETDYTVTLQLLDGGQTVHAQRDGMPLDGTAPTTSWTVGEVLPDSLTLDIPPNIGPAPHQLLIALYQAESGQRLPVVGGGDHIRVPISIP